MRTIPLRNSPILLAAVFALTGCAGEGRRTFLSIGTAGTGGIYYPLGGALASRLSVADSARQYTAEVTGGSVENVNRVINGEMDLGFSLASTIVEAYNGGPDHPTPAPTLRMVAPLYPNVTHVLAATGSDVRSLADAAGRRVSVGAPGSGTEQVARELFQAYGYTYDDFDARYLSFRESSDALRDGAIDVAVISVGFPAAAVLEALTAGAAYLIPIDRQQIDAMVRAHSYNQPAVIPAGAYPGQAEAVATTLMMNWIVADQGLDASVVDLVLHTLTEERQSLERVHQIAKQIDMGALANPPIPLHAATIRWLETQR